MRHHLPARWAVILELPEIPGHCAMVRSPMARTFTRRGASRRRADVAQQPAVVQAQDHDGGQLKIMRLDRGGWPRG